MPENKTDTSSTVSSENDEDFSVTFASNVDSNGEEIAILTSEEKAKHWMEEALQSFDPTNKQYSVYLNEQSGEDSKLTIEDIKRLAKNAQSDLSKILKINSLVRQEINEDDIIGKVYEAVVANLNANVRISFDNLPQKYTKKKKDEAEKLIKRFHKETNINQILSSSIPTVYTEGNCIKYLREKNGHYVVDTYPLGVVIVSDYNINGNPYILIDIRELTSRLQKTTIKGRKNKPLFFNSIVDEIKNNYPPEVYQAYIDKEHYAKLDIQRCGVNRFCNMNRKYGLTPVFKALKPNLMLDTFDEADKINAKAKAKKIIHQVLRSELLGTEGNRKGLEEMAYAHENLVKAFRNPTVLYTSPPFVEKIEYVEPKAEMSNVDSINQYRSRVTSALGISFLNTDGKQTVSTANISIKQLMKTINKIAEQEEKILEQWYCLILQENDIPLEYCPTPHILDAELLEFEMRKDLSELLFSKYNCSYSTAYELVGMDVRDEIEKRKQEKELGYEEILSVHPTSYNSAGDSTDSDNKGGRPSGSDDEQKQEYDSDYNLTRV
ncbi:hypothetical protein NSB25_25930 [Acetatifactor muris]|uniref:Phage portal protein, SPP1 Gp6-like n=1 Tax=Acetatifactor muris TaxID=879566 RepID=A0A2K4ZP13_9FIRM|nr:hypothetical protein [Acetatifactor muris]MCR2050677.1 hypothetical protein [Acetatifactor muris]SOY32224.1 hypothetical protein AMURIS_04982 [Acetatifactor muris]